MCPNSAYVDADWCRAINPFQFTEATKKTVTDNIFCLFRNYLLCTDIETVIFPYGFHGERKSIYNEVIRRLRDEGIIFEKTVQANDPLIACTAYYLISIENGLYT